MNTKSNSLMKMGILLGIIIVLFAGIFVLNDLSKKDKMKKNIYDKDDLNLATIELLSDENYQNIISPSDLKKKIESGETVYAYFFSPVCEYCKNFTPKLMPIAKEYDLYIDQLNLLEYPDEWGNYKIAATPTLIVFNEGKEYIRIMGDYEESELRSFLDSVEDAMKTKSVL